MNVSMTTVLVRPTVTHLLLLQPQDYYTSYRRFVLYYSQSSTSINAFVVLLTAMERLAAAWPAETKDLLNGLAGILTELTDGVPVAEKPKAAAVVDSVAGGK